MAANVFRKVLFYRLVPAAAQAALVGLAMLDRSVGIGVLIGIGVSAIVSMVRGHRQLKKAAAASARLDQELETALARRALRTFRRGASS